MKTKFIAMITATAIAFTGISAPSVQAADNGEIARFLLGVGIIAAIANEASKSQAQPAPVQRRQNHRHNAHNNKPPKKCLRQRYTNHGWKKYYSHRCLKKNGYRGPHRHW